MIENTRFKELFTNYAFVKKFYKVMSEQICIHIIILVSEDVRDHRVYRSNLIGVKSLINGRESITLLVEKRELVAEVVLVLIR